MAPLPGCNTPVCAEASGDLTAGDWRVILALGAVVGITIFQSISYYQFANVLPVWLEQHMALDRGSFAIPAPWYQSIDPLFSILGVPLRLSSPARPRSIPSGR